MMSPQSREGPPACRAGDGATTRGRLSSGSYSACPVVRLQAGGKQSESVARQSRARPLDALGVLGLHFGIVANKVDNILHGMELGTAGQHSQVRLWAAQGGLATLVERLHAEGFHVFLTADHGNVAASGIGSPKEGVLVEFKGKRARVYDSPSHRKVEIQWLDAILDRVAAGSDFASTRAFLHEMLMPQHPAKEARQKTAGIITRIWQLVTPEYTSIRDDAVAILASIPPRDRIWLHWGMASLTYPLFHDTAAAIGRLLKLQGDFTLAQLERRLIEDWGDRSTLKRAVQRIVRSMVQWGALVESGRGCFSPATKLNTRSTELHLWFLEAAHRAEQNGEVESHQLMNLPMAFPLKITVGLGDLRRSKHFMIHRQGLDMDMVAVRGRKASSETANVA